ncbi:MAG: transferase, partial [Selenomonadaceae bacterium]|nr:transferase [Selenomonadaceae bacterium]
GKCKIGAEVFIGSGAILLPKATVGDCATIGAGSVVLKKVRAGSTVFGNPAIEFNSL